MPVLVYIFVVALCGGVDADLRYDFALLPLYGVRLVTYILIYLYILVVLPSGKINIVDVVVTHPSQVKYVNQACTRVGHAAARAEVDKVDKFREIGEDAGQYDFVPFAVESYGRLGASAQSFLKELDEVAAARGSISKAAFVKSAFREVSCAL